MPPLDLYPAYLIYIFKRAWCGGAVLDFALQINNIFWGLPKYKIVYKVHKSITIYVQKNRQTEVVCLH